MHVYLDNGATTRTRDEVIKSMVEVMTVDYGNPSSIHRMGVNIEKKITNSRKSIAKAINASSSEIYFTSGGTEANNIAIFGSVNAYRRSGNHIITTKIEHPSVLSVYKHLEDEGYNVTYLKVNDKGVIDIEHLKESITDDTILISIMMVNNETGAIQPIKEICKYVSKLKDKPLVHVDAIQGYGKVEINLKKTKVDLMTLSSHKVYGPKGVGALFVRKGVRIKPITLGGSQELGIRSGTENTPGIVGFGVATDMMMKEFEDNHRVMLERQKKLLDGIVNSIDDIKINTDMNNCAPHILNISFNGIRGEVLLHSLESKGIYVSTGSACSSKKKSYSHVLKEMGLNNWELEGAIRFSINPWISNGDIEYVINQLVTIVADLRAIINRR